MAQTPKRQEKLRDLLLARQAALLATLRKSMVEQRKETGRMSFEIAQDDGDKSVEEHERHVRSAVQSLKADQLDTIEQALEKLAAGSYGICEDCGCDIPLQRLAIQPFTSYCVSCQEKIDKLSRRETLWNNEINASDDESYDYLTDEQ